MPKTNPKTATPSQLPDPAISVNLRIIEAEGPTDFRFLEAALMKTLGTTLRRNCGGSR